MSLWFLMQNVSLTSHKIHDFRSMWLDYHSTLLDVEILNSNFSSITERLANEVNSQYEVQRNIDASKGGNHLTQSDRNNITNDHINNYDFFFFFFVLPSLLACQKGDLNEPFHWMSTSSSVVFGMEGLEFPEPSLWLAPVFTCLPCPAPTQGGSRPTQPMVLANNAQEHHQHPEVPCFIIKSN